MTTRLAIAQYGVEPGDAEQARSRSRSAVRDAIALGAQIVVLPELAVPGYTTDEGVLRAAAEPTDGETVRSWSELAQEAGAVIVGGICEADGDALYNSAVLVGPDGLRSVYRKLHLFGPEKDVFAPGDRGLPVVATPHGTLGVCVCYDLRFPEVVRVLALRGAQLIAVPTAWVPGFDVQMWNAEGMCPQAVSAEVQANLSQVVVACASAVGEHGGIRFLGSSVVLGACGERLAGPLSGTDDALACADVDLADTARAQRRGRNIDPRVDRRTDVYTVTYGATAW